MKLLIVVDMQRDFVTGALGTEEARAIVPAVKARMEEATRDDWNLVFTMDLHDANYLNTQEGKLLPVPHCLKSRDGWTIIPELKELYIGWPVFEKHAFGSLELAEYCRQMQPEEIELVGLCTDICVISNALLVKAACPETPVSVRAGCCAGVTPESHRRALEAMRACQVHIIEG